MESRILRTEETIIHTSTVNSHDRDGEHRTAGHDVECPYPPIEDYAFISDCHSSALVSRAGSIDWACMPRLDSPSVFGRMLDWERGGFCSLTLADAAIEIDRRYLDDTLVLETRMRSAQGSISVVDAIAMTVGGAERPRNEILRTVEVLDGEPEIDLSVCARLDYGGIKPWIRTHGEECFSLIGGSQGLLVWSDAELRRSSRHDLGARFRLAAGERRRLCIAYRDPHTLDPEPVDKGAAAHVDEHLQETIEWWRRWVEQRQGHGALPHEALRSALVLKGLAQATTGAVAAAATTSLPETIGGERNWDYRYSWIRDSWWTVRALADVGFHTESSRFERFVERSAAGSGEDLQLMFGVDGSHRLPEVELQGLQGYRGSSPVRIGNQAREQMQLDVYGYLVDLARYSEERGDSVSTSYWELVVDLVDTVSERWHLPDRGIWEIRSPARHFVHSKVMCWAAVEDGCRLAERPGRSADADRWAAVRDDIRSAIESRGVSRERGCFVQCFDAPDVDAALLLLPATGFVAYDDERFERTVDAVIEDLDEDGFVRRYRTEDGLSGAEGTFLACTFWLAECLARMGRLDEARGYFDRACGAANDVGLFAEEYDPTHGHSLGNVPQALSHLGMISALNAMTASR